MNHLKHIRVYDNFDIVSSSFMYVYCINAEWILSESESKIITME